MNPIDLRNATWEDLQDRVTGLRRMVLDAYRVLGATTTRRLATLAAMDILTVRPRTTELVQLGLLRLKSQSGLEGVYEALSDAEAKALFAERQAQARRGECQPELDLQ